MVQQQRLHLKILLPAATALATAARHPTKKRNGVGACVAGRWQSAAARSLAVAPIDLVLMLLQDRAAAAAPSSTARHAAVAFVAGHQRWRLRSCQSAISAYAPLFTEQPCESHSPYIKRALHEIWLWWPAWSSLPLNNALSRRAA